MHDHLVLQVNLNVPLISITVLGRVGFIVTLLLSVACLPEHIRGPLAAGIAVEGSRST